MSMIRVAKDNPEALAGLKSSMLDAALVKAGGTSETFSPRALYETLFTKIPNAIDRNTTLMNIMLKNNVIKEGEANNFKKLIEEMVKLEAAESVGKLGEVIEGTGAIMDFYLRITGSAIGTRLQGLVFGGQGPGSLVAAGAGSKALRNLFNSIPESMKTDVMTEVMENPQLLATLLRKTKDQQQKQNIASKLKKILAKAGYIVIGKPVKESFRSAPFVIREIEEEEIDMTDPTFEGVGQQSSVDLPKAGFPTTQTATVPQSGVNARLAANVGTAPQAAPNLNQRQQFASLFPNDPISGLINAQQPVRMREGGGVGEFSDTDSLSVSDMGLETDLAAQEQVQGGLDPYGDTGINYSTDVQKALYNPQGFQKGRKTDYMKKMLSLGLADRVQKDASGKITGIFSGKSPSYMEQFQMDPLGTTLKAVVPGAGIVDLLAGLVNPNREVYTGYNPPNIQTKDNLNNNDNEGIVTLRPRQEFQEAKRMINPMDIYLADPNRYRLFGR